MGAFRSVEEDCFIVARQRPARPTATVVADARAAALWHKPPMQGSLEPPELASAGHVNSLKITPNLDNKPPRVIKYI